MPWPSTVLVTLPVINKGLLNITPALNIYIYCYLILVCLSFFLFVSFFWKVESIWFPTIISSPGHSPRAAPVSLVSGIFSSCRQPGEESMDG